MRLSKYILEKGDKVIIVSSVDKDTGGDLVSSIVLHTAYILSNNVSDIDSVRITSQDRLIYLCGHGNLEEKTIGGRSIPNIAKMLATAGYDGTQDIFITSCDSNIKTEIRLGDIIIEMTLAEYLKFELARMVDCEQGVPKALFKITSVSDGSSIVVEDNNERVLYVITAETTIDKGLLLIQNTKQRLFIDKQVSISSNLANYQKELKTKITWSKNRLLLKEYKSVEIGNTVNGLAAFLAIFIAFGLTFGLNGIQIMFNMRIPYTISILVVAILLIACDLFTRYLSKPREYNIVGIRFGALLSLAIIKYTIYGYLLIETIIKLWV